MNTRFTGSPHVDHHPSGHWDAPTPRAKLPVLDKLALAEEARSGSWLPRGRSNSGAGGAASMVAEKYAVRLWSEDRDQLERLIRSGQRLARVIWPDVRHVFGAHPAARLFGFIRPAMRAGGLLL